MQQLEGDGLKESVKKKWAELLEWLKPNPRDSGLVIGLKMIYKAIAVLALLAVSPILLVVLLFIFFAAF
jgi:hypothetical protein